MQWLLHPLLLVLSVLLDTATQLLSITATIIVTFVSGFTSAGVAAGSLAAATQATIGHFTLFLISLTFAQKD